MSNSHLVPDTSWGFRIFGHRSLLSWVFGTFFTNRANTSGILAVVLLSANVYFYAIDKAVAEPLFNALMVSLGFYFGGKSGPELPPGAREVP